MRHEFHTGIPIFSLQFTKIASWNGRSIKKKLKEIKQKRKDQKRLQEAEIHAAISVAGVAAALAVIAAEESEANKHKSLKESAVASAAALVAAQCAQVAEAVGAKREEISSAINEAVTARDASNIITLTAATATCIHTIPCNSIYPITDHVLLPLKKLS